MNRVGAYGDYRRNMDVLQNPSNCIQEENVSVNLLATNETESVEGRNVKATFNNAPRKYVENANWGRVIQKTKESSNLREDNQSIERSGTKKFMCAFIETPTSVELFEKARNMDRRNVEERTFAAGGKVFDFTV